MKVIAFAEVTCDDCGKSLRRLALPYTKAGKWAEKRLIRALESMAASRLWRMEGPSLWAGDLCPGCWQAEKELGAS